MLAKLAETACDRVSVTSHCSTLMCLELGHPISSTHQLMGHLLYGNGSPLPSSLECSFPRIRHGRVYGKARGEHQRLAGKRLHGMIWASGYILKVAALLRTTTAFQVHLPKQGSLWWAFKSAFSIYTTAFSLFLSEGTFKSLPSQVTANTG